jgi:molecular chaperone GrpE
MTDIEQTAEQQAAPSPGAPGEGAPEPHQRAAATSAAPPEKDTPAAPTGEDAGEADAGKADAGKAVPAESHPEAGASELSEDAAEVEGDLDELVKTAAERDEYLALAQRTQADFENYRKRVARDSVSAQTRGVISLAKELLPALDNLDRALEAAAKDDPLLEGVRLVRSELSAALARMGIESFSPAGEAFDPSFHEAVATSDQSADGAASGTVVEVYQPGYRLGESVLRPARVVVAA